MKVKKKLDIFLLEESLNQKGWKGKYYGIYNQVTYLTENNKTIAIVDFKNNERTKIKKIEWIL